MPIDHIRSRIYNLRMREVILISDSTTLLDYRHKCMGSLHIVNSRSRTRACLVAIYIRYWSAIDSL